MLHCLTYENLSESTFWRVSSITAPRIFHHPTRLDERPCKNDIVYRGDLFKGLYDTSNIWFKKEKILQATTSLEPWEKFYSTLIWKTALDNLSRILNIFNFWTCANFNLFSFKNSFWSKKERNFIKDANTPYEGNSVDFVLFRLQWFSIKSFWRFRNGF